MNKISNIKIDEILSVYDGDTFRGRVNAWPKWLGESVSFRIAGIDTPEIRGSSDTVKLMAYKARDFVRDTFDAAKDIRFDIVGKDKYGRILARVWVDNVNLAARLIETGLAYEYDGGSKQKW